MSIPANNRLLQFSSRAQSSVIQNRSDTSTSGVRNVIFLAQALWALLLLGLSIYKLASFGIRQYVIHFTNWSWTLQALFYTFTLFIFVPETLTCGSCVIQFVFLPLFGTIWAVALGVQILLLYDDDFIVTLFTKHAEGLVIFGNDVYHVWPIIAIIFFIALNFAVIYNAINRLLLYSNNLYYRIFIISYQLFLGSTAFFSVYLLVLLGIGTSMGEVYETDISEGLALLGIIVTSLVANGILFGIWLCFYGIAKRSLFATYNRRRLFSTDYNVFAEMDSPLATRLIDS